MKFHKISARFYTIIQPDGRVEVREASSDCVKGRLYFSSRSKAFKVTTLLIQRGLVCVKRSGIHLSKRGHVTTDGGYHLGAILVPKKYSKEQLEVEKRRSELLHNLPLVSI